ncbi:MAG: hypothetical protein ACXU8N_06685 [Telluria sp.]
MPIRFRKSFGPLPGVRITIRATTVRSRPGDDAVQTRELEMRPPSPSVRASGGGTKALVWLLLGIALVLAALRFLG